MKVYGGLWFENMVAQDKYYDLQCDLLDKGLIEGVQLRVAHPTYTPGIVQSDLHRIMARWGGEVFIHFGAENVGVDFGEVFDELGIFHERGDGRSWKNWNIETLEGGLAVARESRAQERFPWGVVHAGYGHHPGDDAARQRILDVLRQYSGNQIAIEVVPAICNREFYQLYLGEPYWPAQNQFWGFGSWPDDMRSLLCDLGPEWKCFYDFTYLQVNNNQMARFSSHVLERTLQSYLDLPHWNICHFSGITDALAAVHLPLKPDIPPSVLKSAMAEMEIVCLEIPFRPETAHTEVEWFRKHYM